MVKDHRGNKYVSLKYMCEDWGISVSDFKRRIANGETLESVLSFPEKKPDIIKDHYGNIYYTIEDMCETYGVDIGTYNARIANGYSLQEALEPNYKHRVVDHKGIVYDSVNQMCAVYKIPRKTYLARVSAGWSKERALEDPVNRKIVYDHNGIEYESLDIMCMVYNISVSTYTRRIKAGWNKEKALTTSVKDRGRRIKVYDHRGVKYNSVAEMCKAYGISKDVYYHRLRAGWTQEKALKVPVGRYTENRVHKEVYDHLGNRYHSVQIMCKTYGLSRDQFLLRINSGWSLKDALTIPLGKERK